MIRIEGGYLSLILSHFHNKVSSHLPPSHSLQGIFTHFENASSARDIAKKYNYDADLFIQLLEFIRHSTDILILKGDFYPPSHSSHIPDQRYLLNPKYKVKKNQMHFPSLKHHFKQYGEFGHHLDKFLGAYAPSLFNLEKTLTGKDLGREFVQDDKLATAFYRLNPRCQMSYVSMFILDNFEFVFLLLYFG